VDGGVELLQFLFEVAGRLAGPDIGVDLRPELAADDHRVQRVVTVVRGDDSLSLGDLLADELRVAILPLCDPFHRFRDLSGPCALELRRHDY